jgi:hypothetical protein
MSRFVIGFLCVWVVTGFGKANAAEPHQEWMKFLRGTWTYGWDKMDIRGEVTYRPAAKQHALIARGTEEDDAWVEVIGWRPDVKKMVYSGYGAKNNNYWHSECGDVSKDRIAGETFGVLPDGRTVKGQIVAERAGDDSFVLVLKVRVGDEELVDTGKFTRVKK